MKKTRVAAMLCAGLLCFACGCGDDHEVNVSGVASRPGGAAAVDYSSSQSQTAAAENASTESSTTAAASSDGSKENSEAESEAAETASNTDSGTTQQTQNTNQTDEQTAAPVDTAISQELAGDGSILMVFPDKKKYEYEQDYLNEDFVDFEYKVSTQWSDDAATNTGSASVLVYAPSSDAALNAALSAAEKSKVTVVVYGHAPVKTRARAWFVTYDETVKGDKELIYGQSDEEAVLKELTDGKISSLVFKDVDEFLEVVEDVTMAILDEETPGADDIQENDWDADCSYSTDIAPTYTVKPLVVTKDNYEVELVEEGYYDERDDGTLYSDWDED